MAKSGQQSGTWAPADVLRYPRLLRLPDLRRPALLEPRLEGPEPSPPRRELLLLWLVGLAIPALDPDLHLRGLSLCPRHRSIRGPASSPDPAGALPGREPGLPGL